MLFWFAHGWWERFWGIVANVLIGVGLAAEYVVIGRAIIAGREAQQESDERVGAAEAQSAEANARAAEALAEQARILKMVSGRRISPEQHGKLVASLRGHETMDVIVAWAQGDPEATLYGHDIIRMACPPACPGCVKTLCRCYDSPVILGRD
jgi:hypothetical protein